jgi:hypothetical protein
MSPLSDALDRIRAIVSIVDSWISSAVEWIPDVWGWCAHNWEHRPRRRRFVVNFLLGTLVVLVLALYPGAKLIDLGKDDAMDRILSLRYKLGLVHSIDAPMALIDIDEDTYKSLREPLVLPRDCVAQLLEGVLAAQPRLVVLDVDLAPRGKGEKVNGGINTDCEPKKSDHQASSDTNSPIEEALKKHLGGCGKDCIPIVLVASLRCPPAASSDQCEARSLAGLDGLVDHYPNLYLATPAFYKDADGTVRSWPLWQIVTRGSALEAMPSVSLLAAALLRNGDDRELKAFLGEQCRQEAAKRHLACSNGEESAESQVRAMMWEADGPSDCPLREASWNADGCRKCIRFDERHQRIIYALQRIRDPLLDSDPDSEKAWFIPGGMRSKDGTETILLVHIPAKGFMNKGRDDAVLKDPLCALDGRVVFIGGSYEDARDIHETPLGRMPGVLIMVNSLTSLLEQGDLSPIAALQIPFLVLLVLGASLAFAYIRSTLLAALTVVIVVLLILMPLGVCCVRFIAAGQNVGLALLAMTVHQVILDLWEGFSRHRQM